MSGDRVIGIDWGTTNRRCYLIEDGTVLSARRDDRGILAMTLADYAPEVAAIRDSWGGAPVLIAGMAGSNRGWLETTYVDCPARLERLAAAIGWIEPGAVGIVPGVCQRAPGPDVMRGEEVQLLGALAAGLAPDDALLCQPGTHCKWAWVKDGAITRFSTAMTGELFSLLRGHSLLADQLNGAVRHDAAFRQGLEDAGRLSLPVALFSIRAASLLGTRPDHEAASYASGLLIGSDVAGQNVEGETVHILADGDLGELYWAAISRFGGTPVAIDSQTAFAAGIAAIWDQVR